MSEALACMIDSDGSLPHVKERECTKDVETPLVGARNESTDKAADYKGDAHEQRGHDVRKRKAGGKKDRKEK